MIASVLATCTGFVLVTETLTKSSIKTELKCFPTEIQCMRAGGEKEVDLRMKGLNTSKYYEFTCIKQDKPVDNKD